jgi:hypothetical protein
MLNIIKLAKSNPFYPEITKILSQLEETYPQLSQIEFWLGLPTKGLIKCGFIRTENEWECTFITEYYRFDDLRVLNYPKLTFTQYRRSETIIDPADQFREIMINGELLQYQQDHEIHQFFNRKFGKRHQRYVFNAGLRPLISTLSKGKDFMINIGKMCYPMANPVNYSEIEAVCSC